MLFRSIMIMFLFVAFLEDSGYMARIAYMVDRVFRAFGLHGCSVMPYIVAGGIAGGCAIPGVMATRTLRSPREKLATLLTLPYMACGAKLPVFLLVAGVFFPGNEAVTLFLLTLAGWAAALLTARLLRSTVIRGESTPFVMELPAYRLPTLRSLLIHCWERTWMYLKKAGTVLVAISILIWAGMTFPTLDPEAAAPYEQRIGALEDRLAALPPDAAEAAPLNEAIEQARQELGAAELRHSLAGRVGSALEPLTRPAGFDWRTNIAMLAGIAAKEAVVATLGTAYSLGEQDPEEVSFQELRQQFEVSEKTSLRDIRLLERAGVLETRYDRNAKAFYPVSLELRPMAEEENQTRRKYLERIRRLCLLMVRMAEEDGSDGMNKRELYRELFPDCSDRTRQRDFQELEKLDRKSVV